ncbi:hypothetical protein Tco_0523224 [Tanacetum coccineum]
MTTLKFADTHNMVAFLSKPAESEGFEQIVDFLNAHPIKHALTVNPTIYTSCIEQFWATVKAKTVNGEVQLQALVDGKKIIITESTVRRDLQLEDAEGVDCLPNATIFEQLALMGYEQVSQKLTFYKAFFSPQWKFLIHIVLQCLSPKTTAWNEFSSTMASAIICLATNQKFNFSKFIFESMVKNLDNVDKFLMYPRKPKRKDTHIPQSSGPTKHVADEAVYKELDDSLLRAATTASSLEVEQDSGNINKTQSKATPNDVGSQGTTSGEVTHFEVTTQANEIASLKMRVKKLEKKDRSRTHKLKRLYKVGLSARVESSGDEEDLGEDASKQGRRIHDIDAHEDITLVNDQDDADIFDVNTLTGDEVLAEQEVAAKDVNLTVDEVTLAQALAALKSVKPKVKANVVEEPSIPVSAASIKVSAATTTITATTLTPRKGIVITKLAKRLQAEFNEEDGLEREKDEANVALTKEWDDIQAKVDVDYQIDLVEGSSKRARDELEQEVTKKQKVDDVQETAEVDNDQEATKI